MMLISGITLFVTKSRVFDDQFLETVTNRSLNEIETMRFKDIERICFAMASFNHKSTASIQLLQKFSQHLLTVEKNAYLIHVIRAIEFMQRCDVCEPKLVAWALDPRTIAQVYSEEVETNRNELLSIDMYAKINSANEYTGPRLSDAECSAIFQRRVANGRTECDQRQIERVVKTLGHQCVTKHILPHFATPGK